MSSDPYTTTDSVGNPTNPVVNAAFATLATYSGGSAGLSSAGEMTALLAQVKALTAFMVARGWIAAS